ncbi:4Fe-4S single cluster domain-containing protein [Streptomyces flavofungini]|uniref:4Fe-4S single cluster domain-containing protein n=1 Tax=Streptomyces flavofungini TaxID=68200 RepID=UPI0025AF7CFB|nr:4Fe-4S single cluster domain-containing protein [Streptomyces flavofungini]WJV44699.1 4Fe-4S single cluster domain-containing protein [Streptomyces flavofungini]
MTPLPPPRHGARASTAVSVARTLDRCTVLGPGSRAVLWVQGCPLRCHGCVAAETLPFEGGTSRTVAELTDWLCDVDGIEGVTLSGGEPFSQAGALAELLDAVRERRGDFGAMAYSGFRHEALRRGGPARLALLDRLDLLVDGPYVAARHGSLRWRGSDNQRLIPLTDRYARSLAEPDTTAGVELSVEPGGALAWAGVPPSPGFRSRLEERLAARGFVLHTEARRER